MSTQFYEVDKWNPNPSLACSHKILKDTMRVVAHRTLPCGSELLICNKALSKCSKAKVMDRGPYGCLIKEGIKCKVYKSEIDLSLQVAKDIDHSGFEEVFIFGLPNVNNRAKQITNKKSSNGNTIPTYLYKRLVL